MFLATSLAAPGLVAGVQLSRDGGLGIVGDSRLLVVAAIVVVSSSSGVATGALPTNRLQECLVRQRLSRRGMSACACCTSV